MAAELVLSGGKRAFVADEPNVTKALYPTGDTVRYGHSPNLQDTYDGTVTTGMLLPTGGAYVWVDGGGSATLVVREVPLEGATTRSGAYIGEYADLVPGSAIAAGYMVSVGGFLWYRLADGFVSGPFSGTADWRPLMAGSFTYGTTDPDSTLSPGAWWVKVDGSGFGTSMWVGTTSGPVKLFNTQAPIRFMTASQRVALDVTTLPDGMLVFQTDSGLGVYQLRSGAWVAVIVSNPVVIPYGTKAARPSAGSSVDGATYISTDVNDGTLHHVRSGAWQSALRGMRAKSTPNLALPACLEGLNTVVTASSGVVVQFRQHIIRFVADRTGKLAALYVPILTIGGNVRAGVYDTGDTTSGVRTLLWDSTSLGANVGGTTGWLNLGNPNIDIEVGQHFDVGIQFDSATVAVGRFTVSGGTQQSLPTDLGQTAGAVPYRLTGYNSAVSAYGAPPGTIAIADMTNVPSATSIPILLAKYT